MQTTNKIARPYFATVGVAPEMRPSRLLQTNMTDEEKQSEGMRKVNRNSYRLTRASMLNGSNAALLENRFFKTKKSP